MNSTLVANMQRLREQRSAGDMENLLREVLLALGVEYWFFGVFHADSRSLPKSRLLSSYPISWGVEYKIRKYSRIDYVLRGGFKHTLPLIWNAESAVALPEEKVFNEKLLRRGWRCGVGFYARSPRRHTVAFNSAFRSPYENAKAVIEDILPVGHYLATCVLDSILQLEGDASGHLLPMEPLTVREEEILRWIADGKSAWEIGKISGITERTVRAHLDRIAAKAGLGSRRLVTKAIAAELIEQNLDDMTDALIEWEARQCTAVNSASVVPEPTQGCAPLLRP